MNNQTTKNDPADRSEEGHFPLENELRSIWLGRQDSNLRMTAPKTVALPLGHAPLLYKGN